MGRISVEEAMAGLIIAGDLLAAVLRTESFDRLLLSTDDMTGLGVEVLLVVVVTSRGRMNGG